MWLLGEREPKMYDTSAEDELLHPDRGSGTEGETDEARKRGKVTH